MTKSPLSKLWNHAWSLVLSEMTAQEVNGLVSSKTHNIRLTAYRATTIVSRVRLLAALFAILAPCWVIVDTLALGTGGAGNLAGVRLLSAIAFGGIVVSLRRMHALRDAYRALFLLMMVAAAVFFYAGIESVILRSDELAAPSAMSYAYLPVLLLASMAIFPLTLLEGLAFALPVIAIQIALPWVTQPTIDPASALATISVMTFIAVVSLLAGISQLALMIVLSREALHDPLTRCFSRRGGEELLDLIFVMAARAKDEMALVYISIDHLPEINREFGYDVGNAMLIRAVELLNDQLRSGDALVRWTGTDFVLVMPNARAPQAAGAVGRLLSGGLGSLPNRDAVTASVGVAERSGDESEDWWALIDVAQARAGKARERGGNRTVID